MCGRRTWRKNGRSGLARVEAIEMSLISISHIFNAFLFGPLSCPATPASRLCSLEFKGCSSKCSRHVTQPERACPG